MNDKDYNITLDILLRHVNHIWLNNAGKKDLYLNKVIENAIDVYKNTYLTYITANYQRIYLNKEGLQNKRPLTKGEIIDRAYNRAYNHTINYVKNAMDRKTEEI